MNYVMTGQGKASHQPKQGTRACITLRNVQDRVLDQLSILQAYGICPSPWNQNSQEHTCTETISYLNYKRAVLPMIRYVRIPRTTPLTLRNVYFRSVCPARSQH